VSQVIGRPRRLRSRVALTVAALLALSAAACGQSDDSGSSGTGGYPRQTMQIIAPANPGGGFDQTARSLQKVIESAALTERGVEVKNVPGAGGTVGLGQFRGEKRETTLMVMGLVMVGAILTNNSEATLDDVTPIAKLTEEYEVLVVPASSPIKDMKGFVDAWKADPKKMAIAGGSAGGTDQILAGQVAKAVDIDPKNVNYVPFSGGGESIPALLGNKVQAGISGVAEYAEQIEAGKLRALGVSSAEKVGSVDAPTFKESGVDVTLANWRGLVAPKSVTKQQREQIISFIKKVHGTEGWRKEIVTNGWQDSFQTGDDFNKFLDEENGKTKTTLRDLGLIT